MEMERVGQTKSIYVNTNSEVWGSFTVIQKNNIQKTTNPCEEDSKYSFTDCMLRYVASTASCHLDWVSREGQYDDLKLCRSKEELLRYHGVLTEVSRLPWKQLTNITQCHGKCSYKEFSFTKVYKYSQSLIYKYYCHR